MHNVHKPFFFDHSQTLRRIVWAIVPSGIIERESPLAKETSQPRTPNSPLFRRTTMPSPMHPHNHPPPGLSQTTCQVFQHQPGTPSACSLLIHKLIHAKKIGCNMRHICEGYSS